MQKRLDNRGTLSTSGGRSSLKLETKFDKSFTRRCGFHLLVGYIGDSVAVQDRNQYFDAQRIVGSVLLGGLAACRALVICLLLALLSSECGLANQPEEQLYSIDMPSLNAAEALNRLAEQTGAVLLFPYDMARTRQANPVTGRHKLVEALDLLLEDTGLTGGLSDKGVITISVRGVDEHDDEEKTMIAVKKTFTQKIAAVFVFLFGSSGAMSQEGGNIQGVENTTTVLEEVTVTAQKREQRLQDIGIDATVLSGEQLRQLGVAQPIDLAAQVPGVEIRNTLGNANPTITIRGVGLNDYHSNNNPSAAVHIDDVYLGSPALLSFQLFDIERVEVLKGPQGTLYGRNTTAGAVNFITRKPSDEFDAYVDLSYGNYNALKVESAVGGGITDSLSGRFAVMVNRGDGYVTNKGTVGFEGFTIVPGSIPLLPFKGPDDKASDTDVVAIRGSLDFDPNDQLKIYATVHSNRDKSGGHIYAIDGSESNGWLLPDTLFFDTDGDPFTRYDDSNTLIDSKQKGGQFRIDWNMDSAIFTSISGYEALDRHIVDGDGHPLRLIEWDWFEDSWQFTQELRLTSDTDGDLSWIIGGFYSDEKLDFQKTLDAADWLLTKLDTNYTQTGKSYAFFGHTEWQFAERLNLIFGLRYTNEKKKYDGGSDDLDPWGTTFFIPGGGPLAHAIKHYKTDDVSGKIGLNWTPNENMLVYGSISKGFKSGGFDGSTIFDKSDVTPFNEEILWSYEAGLKSTLADGSLQLNGSVFFYDYQDMQAQALVLVEVGGAQVPSSIRTNAGDVELLGAEFNMWWAPALGWDIKAGISLLDSEIVRWNSIDPDQVKANQGNEVPDAPKFTFNGMMSYKWAVANDMTMGVSADFNYVGKTFKDIVNTPELRADSYALVNAQISLESANNNWVVTLWGKNLANKNYATNIVTTIGGLPGSRVPWYGAPRTYGVRLSYRWQ